MIEFGTTKIFTDNIDEKALDQLKELDSTGVFGGQPVRIMPDVHAGAGCVIGFTAPIADKIIPNLVGVDIGCGMLCVYLGKRDIDYSALDSVIRKHVPSGRNVGEPTQEASALIDELRCANKLSDRTWLNSSLGSLGGGNHFIEVDEDDEGGKYLVVHSGSRNLGKQVAELYQGIAVRECSGRPINEIIAELKAQGKEREIQSAVTARKNAAPKLPKELCYVSGKAMEDYLYDMAVCTRFADLNRKRMADAVILNCGLSSDVDYAQNNGFTTRHNYIGEDGYIRKGAISAKKDERVLIPLNMRDGCIVGIGKGNPDWNYSAPHGAGRVMSRMQARAKLDVSDFKATMKNVYSTTVDASTIDESPFAYKPSEQIIELVRDTVDIERIIKPVYNYKASE